MPVNTEAYYKLLTELQPHGATLIAVSKTKPADEILQLYELGQRHFGENYVQELVEKQALLPADIQWHFIGHLQTNKVKNIAPFVHLIHGVDSPKLLKAIDKEANKCNRRINVLLQVHIAREETKFGFSVEEIAALFSGSGAESLVECNNVNIIGLMGMASFTNDERKVREEFQTLKRCFEDGSKLSSPHVLLTTLSMGMSSDYKLALQEGSTLVRIGSMLFGSRTV